MSHQALRSEKRKMAFLGYEINRSFGDSKRPFTRVADCTNNLPSKGKKNLPSRGRKSAIVMQEMEEFIHALQFITIFDKRQNESAFKWQKTCDQRVAFFERVKISQLIAIFYRACFFTMRTQHFLHVDGTLSAIGICNLRVNGTIYAGGYVTLGDARETCFSFLAPIFVSHFWKWTFVSKYGQILRTN